MNRRSGLYTKQVASRMVYTTAGYRLINGGDRVITRSNQHSLLSVYTIHVAAVHRFFGMYVDNIPLMGFCVYKKNCIQ